MHQARWHLPKGTTQGVKLRIVQSFSATSCFQRRLIQDDESKISSRIIAQYTAVDEVRMSRRIRRIFRMRAPCLDQEWIAEKYERAEHPLGMFKIEQCIASRLSGIKQNACVTTKIDSLAGISCFLLEVSNGIVHAISLVPILLT
jgi:hypothetical protein